jgi:hypothetical protein
MSELKDKSSIRERVDKVERELKLLYKELEKANSISRKLHENLTELKTLNIDRYKEVIKNNNPQNYRFYLGDVLIFDCYEGLLNYEGISSWGVDKGVIPWELVEKQEDNDQLLLEINKIVKEEKKLAKQRAREKAKNKAELERSKLIQYLSSKEGTKIVLEVLKSRSKGEVDETGG